MHEHERSGLRHGVVLLWEGLLEEALNPEVCVGRLWHGLADFLGLAEGPFRDHWGIWENVWNLLTLSWVQDPMFKAPIVQYVLGKREHSSPKRQAKASQVLGCREACNQVA